MSFLLNLGYYLFEFTGSKILHVYDVLTNPHRILYKRKRRILRHRKGNKSLISSFFQRFGGGKTIQFKVRHVRAIQGTPSQGAKKRFSARVAVPATPVALRAPTPTQPAMTIKTSKILKLESELSELRAQIGQMLHEKQSSPTQIKEDEEVEEEIVVETTVASSPAPVSVPEITVSNQAEIITTPPQIHSPSPTASSIQENPDALGIPPPPTPPAPLDLPEACPPSFDTPVKTAPKKEVTLELPKRCASTGPVSLTDIVKRSRSLRSVPLHKSPGGTPVKDKKNSPKVGTAVSTQDFISAALKKKFQNVRTFSPERRLDVTTDLSSWEEDSSCFN